MTTEDRDDDVPEIHPEIRDLLGSLDDEVMPPEVRARMRAVITDQAARRTTSAPARNLRRLAVAWVGAAAAVVVLVAGISAVVDRSGTTGGEDAKSTVVQDEDDLSPTPLRDGAAASSALPVVRPDHLAQDAAGMRARVPARARVQAQKDSRELAGGCAITREHRVGVRVYNVSYRDEPAVLVIDAGPPAKASVYSCDNRLLQTARLR